MEITSSLPRFLPSTIETTPASYQVLTETGAEGEEFETLLRDFQEASKRGQIPTLLLLPAAPSIILNPPAAGTGAVGTGEETASTNPICPTGPKGLSDIHL